MKKNEIPERQQYVLAFIFQYHEVHHFPPSVDEIADHLKVASSYGVRKHLDNLVERGLVKRVPGIARGLFITPEGKKALEAITTTPTYS